MIRIDALSLKQLRALRAIAAEGSLTAAAAEIGLTAPAIHSQIKSLEAAVGAPVLTRAPQTGRMTLTEIGAEVLRAAHQVEGILSQLKARVGSRFAGRQGHVTLSVVSTGRYFAPRLVQMLQECCAAIDITLRVGNRDAVIDDLDHGRCALAVMGRPPRIPAVTATPLGPHPHGVVLPPHHPLAGADGFDPTALLGETFLSREAGSGTRILMHRFLDRFAEAEAVRIVEMDSNETIKQAVLAGLGIAFLSLHTVADELRAGRLVLLRGPNLPVMRHWYLVRPQAFGPDPAAERIAAGIEALHASYLPKLPDAAGLSA
ncbi:MAG: LysR family transcriptional regulator [Gemmobacter sp.]|uniref:LysR family transcriptional regulator n=1 Tax=Gemmobacter sp. TaxID=1898957 RepID=UPI00391D0F4D